MSSQVLIAPKKAIEAYVRIPQNPVAPHSFVPDHGSSRSVPISPPRARARRNPINTVGSIREKKSNIFYHIRRQKFSQIKSLARARDFMGSIILYSLPDRDYVRLVRYTSYSGDSYI